MNEIKSVCGSVKKHIRPAFCGSRMRPFACLGNTPSGAAIRAALAFPKDKWSLQFYEMTSKVPSV